MTSCHLHIPAFFETTTKNGGRLWQKKKNKVPTSFGKISCKETFTIKKNHESFAVVVHVPQTSFHGVVLQGNTMTQNARAGLLLNSLNLLSGDVLQTTILAHYSANEIIVSLNEDGIAILEYSRIYSKRSSGGRRSSCGAPYL